MNADTESILRAITDIMRWTHVEDSKRMQKTPVARRKPGLLIMYQFLLLIEFGEISNCFIANLGTQQMLF